MALSNVIDSIWNEIGISPDTFRDERLRVYLLHKEKDDKLEVLVTPFGEKSLSKDTVVYFNLNSDNFFFPLNDASLTDHKFKDGTKYLTIESRDGDFVLPYRAKEFPQKIMQNYFSGILEGGAKLFTERAVDLFGKFEDVRRSLCKDGLGAADVDSISRLIGNELLELFKTCFIGLHTPLREAFEDEKNPSEILPRYNRRLKHFFWRTPKNYYNPNLTERIITGLPGEALKIAKHSINSTEDYRKELLLGSDVEAFFKSQNEKAFKLISDTTKFKKRNQQFLTATNYAAILMGTTAMIGGVNPQIGRSLVWYCLAEIFVSMSNYYFRKHPTGVIGTVRDIIGK